MSVNIRASEYKPAKEKDTARTICIGITVISFALLLLVAALPSRYEKYNQKLDDILIKEAQKKADSKVIPGKDGNLSLIYTLQAGSFDDLQRAGKLYDSIKNDLTSEDLAYLRIEKVGKYYAVRIGKFGEWRNAETFHDKIRPQLSSAIIVQAHIKDERIEKLHSS